MCQGQALFLLLGVPWVDKLYNCHTYVEDLGQSHIGSLAVGQVSVSSFEAGLVVSVSSLVVTLTPLAHQFFNNLLKPAMQDHPKNAVVRTYIDCNQQFINWT